MVVSLYVCDIPQNIEKEELESIFACFSGFVEVRLAKDKNRQKIAFVDYQLEEQAKYAMANARGFRFAQSTKGITVRYSENTRNNTPQVPIYLNKNPKQFKQLPQPPQMPEKYQQKQGIKNEQGQYQQIQYNLTDINNVLNSLLGVANQNNVQQQNQSQTVQNIQPPQSHIQKSIIQDNLSRISQLFVPNIMPIPKNATNTVYVEGIPLDSTEREVAHIFRPFPGYKSVRIIPKEKKPGEKVLFCFADFENVFQTTLVINTLQGYRFDKDDILGLQFSYALTNNNINNTTLR